MEQVKLKIDDQEVITTKGKTILEASLEAGIDIPFFCYHPKLKSVGACRVCLVEVKGMPKLQVACATPANEGMEVFTRNERVTKARHGVIEFILLNHPLDCPTCDKGGECPLQNITYRYGVDSARTSEPRQRFIVDENSTFDDLPIGPEIVRNQNRCIHCYRCTRLVEEVFEEDDLGAYSRGHGTEILPPPGKEIRNLYSGNVVEYCPVGALTNRDWRYKVRVWLTTQKKSVCNLCPDGCNITAWTFRDKIYRNTSRRNDAVDEGFLCDIGRHGYQHVHHSDRLMTPMIRKGGELVECSWSDALGAIHKKLSVIKEKLGPDGIAALVGEDLSNEDYYVLGRYMRSVVRSNSIDHRLHRKRKLSHVDELEQLGIAGTNLTIEDLEKAKLFVVFGGDIHSENPITALRLLKAKRNGGAKILIMNPYPTRLSRSGQEFVYRSLGELPLLTVLSRIMIRERYVDISAVGLDEKAVQLFLNETDELSSEAEASALGISPDDLKSIAKQIAESPHTIFITGSRVSGHFQRDQILRSVYNLAFLTGNLKEEKKHVLILRRGANNRGCYLFGMRPDRLPINKKLTDGNQLSALWKAELPDRHGDDTIDIMRHMQESKVELTFVVGTDPVSEFPDWNFVHSSLSKLDFLVVADLFITESAKLADVLLPLASHSEYSGSLTNWEGRIQKFEKTIKPIGAAKAPWQIFSELATLSEVDFKYSKGEDIFNEFISIVPGADGSKFASWPDGGVCVPSKTRVDTSSGLQSPKVKVPEKDAVHSYILLTGNADHHIGKNKTSRSESLLRFTGGPYVGVSEATAKKMEASAGDLLKVENAQGKVVGPAKIIDGLRDDVVWLPTNFPEMLVNGLMSKELDIDTVSLAKV